MSDRKAKMWTIADGLNRASDSLRTAVYSVSYGDLHAADLRIEAASKLIADARAGIVDLRQEEKSSI